MSYQFFEYIYLLGHKIYLHCILNLLILYPVYFNTYYKHILLIMQAFTLIYPMTISNLSIIFNIMNLNHLLMVSFHQSIYQCSVSIISFYPICLSNLYILSIYLIFLSYLSILSIHPIYLPRNDVYLSESVFSVLSSTATNTGSFLCSGNNLRSYLQ